MDWLAIQCPDGPYEISIEGVTRLIRAYAYQQAVNDNTTFDVKNGFKWVQEVTKDTGGHYDGMRTYPYVLTDWPAVYRQRDRVIYQVGNDFYNRLTSGEMGGSRAIDYLESLASERDEYLSHLNKARADNQRVVFQLTEQNIKDLEGDAAKAKFIRDLSAETELALVGVVTGPALTALALGSGVLIKAVGKGLEMNNVDAATAEGYIELTVAILSSLAKVQFGRTGQKLIVALVFAALKGVAKANLPHDNGLKDTTGYREASALEDPAVAATAGVPSALVSAIIGAMISDKRISIPVSAILKLVVKGQTESYIKRRTNLDPAKVPNLGTANIGEWVGPARKSLLAMKSTCLLDCAKPSTNYISNYAFRPLMSR